MRYTLEQIILALICVRKHEDAYRWGLFPSSVAYRVQLQALTRTLREEGRTYERELLATFGETPGRYMAVGDLLRDTYLTVYGPGTPEHPYTMPTIPKEL